jgi:hypothetical protein
LEKEEKNNTDKMPPTNKIKIEIEIDPDLLLLGCI